MVLTVIYLQGQTLCVLEEHFFPFYLLLNETPIQAPIVIIYGLYSGFVSIEITTRFLFK